MNFVESKVEQFGGIILSIFSLIMYFLVIPAEISVGRSIGVSSRFMPKLVVLLLLLFAIFLLVNGYRKRNKVNQKIYTISPMESKLVFRSLLLLVLYILAFDWLGYMIPTIAVLGTFMYMYGQRNKKLLILISVGFPIFIYLVFTKVLQMPLP